jgi:hypothetical protein
MAASVVRSRQRNGESGVTIAIVALTLVALLGMAALAIDLVNLYVARGETQRAADAAALVGAKALVDAGVTSGDTGSPAPAATVALQSAGRAYATDLATATAQQNLIVGQTGAVAVTFPNSSDPVAFAINPQIQVTITRSGLPSFFAKVWSAGTSTTVATARAEAYNPSNATSLAPGGVPLPVAARCVKPWLMPNVDPISSPNYPAAPVAFFDPATGAMAKPGVVPGGVVGEEIRLQTGCYGAACTTWNPPCWVHAGVPWCYAPANTPVMASVSVYPVQLDGVTPYETSVETCNGQYVACGDQLAIDKSIAPETLNLDAVTTLIHAGGANYAQGQDQLSVASDPFQTLAGNNNPLVTGGVVADGSAVSTSASVITVPVYDSGASGNVTPANSVQVIGFVQGFVTMVSGAGRPRMKILNVSGCGGATGTPIAGGGGTPVPVRLIR